MLQVIDTEKIPIKIWSDYIEDGALSQAKNIANLPFAFRHVAIMPDCHEGYGMPIGGVLATKGAIVPNAVGVDIGCGMCAIKTSLKSIEFAKLKGLLGQMRKQIPVGHKWNKEMQDMNLMPSLERIRSLDIKFENTIVYEQYENASYQLGSLGGGNHFVEIQEGSDGYIWLMVHSGSRNIGKRVAEHYNRIASELNRKWHSVVPKSHQLAFLPLDIKEARAYMAEMQYCVDFALANRSLMIEKVKKVFVSNFKGIEFYPMINIAHNYAAFENHFNENVVVHRKGATSAKEGEKGIIPGSQGTKSYIVEGLGNSESFCSCSHGAGRVMGRKQAIRELDLQEEIKRLDAKGIVHGMRNHRDLDEASSAYKNIDIVMSNQMDLVKVLVELKPLAVMKG